MTVAIAELVSDREAATLLESIRMLREIANRATSAASDLPGFDWKGVDAADCGRLAGVASLANDVVFDVLNVASCYVKSAPAAVAIGRLVSREGVDDDE